jgi:hypothetical protein
MIRQNAGVFGSVPGTYVPLRHVPNDAPPVSKPAARTSCKRSVPLFRMSDNRELDPTTRRIASVA